MPAAPSPEHLQRCNRFMLEMALSREVGLVLTAQSPGRATTQLTVPESATKLTGTLHGNYLYGLMDYTAFLSVVTALRDDESAATHDAHFTLLDPVPLGATVELTGALDRRGRHIAFLSVDAHWLHDGARRLVARARITKSVMSMTQRTRDRTPPGA